MADTITFLHSGDMGDIVASLCSVKEICERDSARAVLLVDTTGGLECNEPKLNYIMRAQTCGHGLKMGDASFEFLRPLLVAQPYIEDALLWKDNREMPVDRNLNWVRAELNSVESLKKTGMNLVFAHQAAMGLECRYCGPWLKFDGKFGGSGIVYARSTRYNSSQFMYIKLEHELCGRGTFIGTKFEADVFENCFGYRPNLVDVPDALNAMHRIIGADMVLFNSTVFFWIAVGVGHPCIMHELPVDVPCSYFPNQTPPIRYFMGSHFLK